MRFPLLLFGIGLLLSAILMAKTPLVRVYQTCRYFMKTSTTSARAMSSSSERPSGLIAQSGIELLTFGTPNGHKISIFLEELKAAYGKPYVYQSINIAENVQKEPWFTKYSPNGRIPAIVDHDRNDFAVFEGLAILNYMTKHYDPEYKLSFEDPDDASRAEQWMAWQHGGVGPMQGQANHFYRAAKERIPYAIQRYAGETERLYGILDKQLKERDYIVGPSAGRYSIADIANFSWVNLAHFSGMDFSKFPNLEKWWERISEREAVKKGTSVPSKSSLVNTAYRQRLKDEPDFKAKEDDLRVMGDRAKEQYNYTYTSP